MSNNKSMAEKKECDNHKWIPLLGIDKKKSVPTSLFTCLKCGDLKVGRQTIKISRFRLDMGELPINSVAGIKLMNPPTVDETASGLIVTATVAVDPGGIGVPLYMNSSGQLQPADATTSAHAPCVALSLETGTTSKKVLLHGVLIQTDWSWTRGPGTSGLIYVSTTAGALIQQADPSFPAGTNQVIQPVGWALSATSIFFAPSLIYLTHV